MNRTYPTITQKEVVIRHGQAAGMRIARHSANPGYSLGTSEPDVQAFIAASLRPGHIFFDVGANIGLMTLVAAKAVGDTGRVYAFEPLPKNAAVLKHNVALNELPQVEIYEAAVCERSGVAELTLDGSTTGQLVARGERGNIPTLRVQTISLDESVLGLGLRPPDLVKIDVEGAEADVLKGMSKIISEYRPTIICELHQQVTSLDVIEQMAYALTAAVVGSDYRVKKVEQQYFALVSRINYRVAVLERVKEDDHEMWAAHAVATPIRDA